MKTRKYIFIGLIAAFMIFTLIQSCKKDTQVKSYTFDATIKDTGSLPADGCDWQLVADSMYHPLNLDDKFKVDGQKVTVTFHKTGSRFFCGMVLFNIATKGPGGFGEIVIDKIAAN